MDNPSITPELTLIHNRPPASRTRPRKTVLAPSQCAADAIGALSPGAALTGFTKGQFSLLDIIQHCLTFTGPAALTVSTWSSNIRDSENIALLTSRAQFTSVRLLIDRSFPGRKPKYVEDVINAWGEQNIRITRNHAKFFILQNATWNICCRSSMNLNRNPRLEQFDIDDSADLCNFFNSITDSLFTAMPPGLFPRTTQTDLIFATSFADTSTPVPDDDSIGDPDCPPACRHPRRQIIGNHQICLLCGTQF